METFKTNNCLNLYLKYDQRVDQKNDWEWLMKNWNLKMSDIIDYFTYIKNDVNERKIIIFLVRKKYF